MNELIEKLPNIQLYQTINCAVKYLRESDYNPRVIGEEEMRALKKSLQANIEFLRIRPIIVNAAAGREGIVIGGAKRLKAAIELGMDKVPVIFVLAETEAKEKLWNVLDNKQAGEWDNDKLRMVVGDLRNLGTDLDSIGYTPGQLTSLMSMDSLPPTDDIPEVGSNQNKILCCPECGYEGNKNDFKKKDSVE